MEDLLGSAHTWFLDSQIQLAGGELRVRLVEGLKGKVKRPLDISDTHLGSFYPVDVAAESRVAEILFESTIATFSFDESFDGKDMALKYAEAGNKTLSRIEQSSFHDFVKSNTTAYDIHDSPLMAWLIWTEDQITLVLSERDPVVSLLPEPPNLLRERTSTWAAE